VAGLSAALVAGVALVAAPAASAAPIGTLTFNNLLDQNTAFSVTTSAACPSTPTLSTNFLIRVSGGNLPVVNPLANITGNTAGSTVGGITTSSFTAGASNTLFNFATAQGLAGGLGAGTYTVELVCRQAIQSASLGEFTGQFSVSATGAVTPIVPVTATTTTITSASPAAGATNAPATFSATVTPATATGTVQFSVDGVALGAPATVTAGVATSPATGLLTAGAHNVVGVFTDGTAFGPSTSPTFVYNVAGISATSSTNLTLSAATVAYPGAVTATATVTSVPVASSGTVQFKVDGTNFGAPVAVSATGVATTSLSLPVQAAAYAVTAVYSGATISGTTVAGSTSPSAPLTVTAPTYAADVQYFQTTVPAGTLVISTPYTAAAPLDLGPMVLNATATEYKSTGAFTGIQVTDTRPGNLPYTLQAVSSDLAKNGVALPGVNEKINASNVGLTGLTLTSTNATPNTFLGGVVLGGPTAGQNLTGFDNPAAAHLAAGVASTAGLGGSSKAVLHANTGLGTTVTAGTLTITAPTNTLDGLYKGTITFTIIGS
jgi:hypothetical protein